MYDECVDVWAKQARVPVVDFVATTTAVARPFLDGIRVAEAPKAPPARSLVRACVAASGAVAFALALTLCLVRACTFVVASLEAPVLDFFAVTVGRAFGAAHTQPTQREWRDKSRQSQRGHHTLHPPPTWDACGQLALTALRLKPRL